MGSGTWARMQRGSSYPGMSMQPSFVEGDFSGFADEDKWKGVIYRSGTHQYNSVQGGVKTIKKYTLNQPQ